MPPTSLALRSQAIGRLLPTVVLAASFVASAVGAAMALPWLLVGAAAVGLATELVVHRWLKQTLARLGRLRVDATLRQVLRDLLLVVGVVRTAGAEHEGGWTALLLGLLAVYGLHFVSQGAAILVRRTRTLPFVTRNIDTSGLKLTAAPPALLLRRPGHRLLSFGLPATAGLIATVAADETAWALAGIGVSLVLSLAGIVRLAVHLLPRRRALNEERALAWLDEWLAAYGPTTGMYFSGGASSAYQANMWLEPLAALPGRPIIILRERFMVQKIAATDLPVLCLPKVAHLMRIEQSTLKSLVHPSNSGKTSQVLRMPGIKHAFINHGESDKLSSCNPYAKAYDEVWVAGPAARERYALADVGVEDKDIVEIGRPQLKGIDTVAPGGSVTTVLYAPTWEGWDGQPGNTSVIEAGENIVRRLLADPKVRLLYKPHPMTGSVDPRAGAANERIQELIRAANGGRAAAKDPKDKGAAELERLAAELDRLTAADYREGSDEMERMLVQGTPSGGRDKAVDEATRRWEDAYWASLPEDAHQIITGPRPALYSCFNQADVLISDVSSVVSDYLASGKPYAVANTAGVSETQFRTDFPTVRAATILTPDAAQVPELLAAARDASRDGFAQARGELKRYLLGPDEPSAQSRFARAVEALSAKALEREERQLAREGTSTLVPSQADRAAAARATVAEGEEERDFAADALAGSEPDSLERTGD
ncbi:MULTISPECIES: hypothetical protein [Streptomyces]|uniref:Integral membrane protein n=1 Tax=Streptomyces evansiae TaxID=3075535 RepID=A0ABU2R3Q7_9ACTN|nr:MULTISPECIES: hypothetical protein [unclassified Streptomyces]MDT0411317.1 hypothetical protein [Streptomyces sp. DSM 41979]MYQ56800.1 hypothetical protein [Streptomyces sp. SID4926]SCD45943.1 hypothetical protein GA0115252_10695 [Streptomyces sp. DfronAA-171]